MKIINKLINEGKNYMKTLGNKYMNAKNDKLIK